MRARPVPLAELPAEELNERIRTLMLLTAGFLNEEQRYEYGLALEAWAKAVRDEPTVSVASRMPQPRSVQGAAEERDGARRFG